MRKSVLAQHLNYLRENDDFLGSGFAFEIIHGLESEEGVKRRKISLKEKPQNFKWLSY